jgi:gamma-glutamyl:cysteine ligase YbdK (ATP-grasp superfamily)
VQNRTPDGRLRDGRRERTAGDGVDVARLDVELARLRELVDGSGLADGRGLIGVEFELHLIDADGRPSPCDDVLLAALGEAPFDLQSELARFDLEVDLPPVTLTGTPLSTIRDQLDGARDAATRVASHVGSGTTAVSIGTLPTIEECDVTSAASLQVHLDLPADGFPAAWNVAQAIAAVQIAVAANSPVLLGRTLWHETRVPLLEQLIDIRGDAARMRGAPPRVRFGERWIDHPADLFAEDLAHFRDPLVAATAERASAEDGERLGELVLHNGTVQRWNRPVYAAGADRPTLRIENRVLSAPPTAVDAAADAALFIGLVAGLRDDVEALTAQLPFAQADANFRSAARHGLAAPLHWPGVSGTTSAGELLADRLIEVAGDGLDALGVRSEESGPALDVIAARASEGRNGATWQLATLREEELHHDRRTALQRMLLRYRDLQAEGEPVHRWTWPATP